MPEVIGSTAPSQHAVAPQHADPEPVATRRAACPYFSLTTSFIGSMVHPRALQVCSGLLHTTQILNGPRFNCFATGAALSVQKAEQLPKGLGVCRIPKVSALA